MNNTGVMCGWAMYYAGMGLPVFPVKTKGKAPLTEHGCKDATTDIGQIVQWWERWPDANIGIATGAGDRPLCVLDVDVNHDLGKYGDETLDELLKQYGQLPETWLCLTGGGGLHYYFFCNDPALTIGANVLPGLDFRGRGGYVVAPPSLHESGNRYEWEASNDPSDGAVPAEIPSWLHDLLIQGKRKDEKKAPNNAPESVTQGSRNQEMFRLACSLRAKGLTVEEITAAMMKANETRCNPPLSTREIESICKSAGRYERGKGSAAPKAPGTVNDAESVKPPDYSDAGNAAVFSRIYKGDLIYVDALGWLYWNGKKWERNEHKAMKAAIKLSARMLKEAIQGNRDALIQQAEAQAKYAETGDDADKEILETAKREAKAAKAFLTHAQNLRGAIRLRNMIELSKPELVIKADKLDANPLDLNTPAGIVNLTTGQIRPHERNALCSQITTVAPSSNGIKMWTDFLHTITCGDQGILAFLQMVSGMALIGSVYHEGIVIACGSGRNGKSTFFNALGSAMGDYTGSIDIKALTTDRGNKGAALAMLRGKRLVITGELEEHQRLSSSILKQVASTDKLVIEEKYKAPETVKQSHTLVLFTNFLPRVGSTDNGTWRRLLVVPFNATIPEGSGVQNYAEVLQDQAGGAILSWAIEGAMMFIRNGFKLDIPDVVAEATEEYRAREDWLSNFIDERCIKEPGARVAASALYAEYKAWAQGNGDYVRRERDFSEAMEAAGYARIKPKNKSTYLGVRIDYAGYGLGVVSSQY